jgi:hypothetical protein
MEEGTLSIVKRESGYQVRYTATNPRAPDHPPYACPDETTVVALLHQLGTESEAITQACATVRKGGVGGAACACLSSAEAGVLLPDSLSLHTPLPTLAPAATPTGAKSVESTRSSCNRCPHVAARAHPYRE